jgi:hypothetical protein
MIARYPEDAILSQRRDRVEDASFREAGEAVGAQAKALHDGAEICLRKVNVRRQVQVCLFC